MISGAVFRKVIAINQIPVRQPAEAALFAGLQEQEHGGQQQIMTELPNCRQAPEIISGEMDPEEAAERIEQHETDSKGQALLLGVIADLGWTATRIADDYGRDFDAEVFRDHRAVGVTFSIQLKSSVVPEYSARREFISHELSRRHALLFARRMRHPILLIIADVARRRLFWASPQLDPAFLSALTLQGRNKTYTIRVPVANELPSSTERMIGALKSMEALLASRVLTEVTIPDFAAAVRDRVDPEALSASLRDKSDYLVIQRARDQSRARDFEAARASIESVISDPRASTTIKFNALLQREETEFVAITSSDAPQELLGKNVLDTCAALRILTRKGPPSLKLYAVLARLAGEFNRLAHKDLGLYMNWKGHSEDGDILWQTQLVFERFATASRLIKKYNQFLRVSHYASSSRYRPVILLALLRIASPASLVLQRYELEGLPEAAAPLRESALRICKFVAACATEYGDDNTVARSAIAAASLSRDPDSECIRWARAELEGVEDEESRRFGRTIIEHQIERIRNGPLPEDPYQQSTPKQIYENMATAAGINMTDPLDEKANLVRLGIKDLNVGRVLKHCEHLEVALKPMSDLSRALKLPTMGPKRLRCQLHGVAMAGLALDEVYNAFNAKHCAGCKDCAPRPDDWSYSLAVYT